jgi:hypothetical protein
MARRSGQVRALGEGSPVQRGRFPWAVPQLSRNDLKAICAALGLATDGREKHVLLDRSYRRRA